MNNPIWNIAFLTLCATTLCCLTCHSLPHLPRSVMYKKMQRTKCSLVSWCIRFTNGDRFLDPIVT